MKAPFHSYKSTDDRDWLICWRLSDAESTRFGPRKPRCSVRPVFPIEHSCLIKRSCVPACTSHLVTVPASYNFHTINSSDRNAPKQAVKAVPSRHGDQVTRFTLAQMSTRARAYACRVFHDQENHLITLHESLSELLLPCRQQEDFLSGEFCFFIRG